MVVLFGASEHVDETLAASKVVSESKLELLLLRFVLVVKIALPLLLDTTEADDDEDDDDGSAVVSKIIC